MTKFRQYCPIIYILFLAVNIFTACGEEIVYYDYTNEPVIHYKNPTYPQSKEHLKILCIGNSLTDDATTYLSSLIDNAGIDRSKVCVYSAIISSSGIDDWLKIIHSNMKIELSNPVDGIHMNSWGTMNTIIAQDWDVIVIQQASHLSYNWYNYNNLGRYVSSIISRCVNKNVFIAFQMVWSHSKAEDPVVYRGNLTCAKQVEDTLGINTVIPTGDAIQKARASRLNTDMYLTRDNWHLDEGIGKYIASCTWFQHLITPVFGISILGNSAKPNGNYSVEDCQLAHKCAFEANIHNE